MVVYGHDGLDELTTTTGTTVVELDGGEVRTSRSTRVPSASVRPAWPTCAAATRR